MNASSTGSSCKEVAGGAAGAQTGLSGMLDSPKDMKAYVQAYFAQMAGMQKTHIHVYYINLFAMFSFSCCFLVVFF